MPGKNLPSDQEIEKYIADLRREVARLRRAVGSGGFDPNADPVVIGSGANGHASPRSVAIGTGADAEDGSGGAGYEAVALGADAYAGLDGAVALGTGAAATAVNSLAAGYNASADGSASVGVGRSASASGDDATAVGHGASASSTHSTALGADATTTAAHQVMLGTDADFVEIPGDSSTAPNGLVLTDTATGTRYIVQITSGALVLNAAP